MRITIKIIAIFLLISSIAIAELSDAGFSSGGLGDSGFTSGLGDAGLTSGMTDSWFSWLSDIGFAGGLSDSAFTSTAAQTQISTSIPGRAGSFSGTGFDFTGFAQDLPAEWKSLENKQIPRGSADNTVVYAGVTGRCDDPDGPEFVTVISQNLNYNLFVENEDLKIKMLFPDYEAVDKVKLSCNGVEASFYLQIGAPQGGARWQPLSNQFVRKGSPDGTVVYPNIVSGCVDNTASFLVFKILSGSNNYRLFIIGSDLRIYNLNPSFTGTETVTLSCNDVAAAFQLTVGEGLVQPRFEPEEDKNLEVHIGTIVVPEQTEAGTVIPVIVSFRNTGDDELEDLKVRAVIPELGAVSPSAGPFDLNEGKRTTQTLLVEVPENVLPDTYTVRLTIDSASLHRVVHRDLVVE